MHETPIEIETLNVRRGGRDVLFGVSLSIRNGAITALLGANGAGKSTLILTVLGLLPAQSGVIRLGAKPILGEAPDRLRRRGVCGVLEGHRVLGLLSVLDNLKVAALPLARREAAAEIDQVLDLFPELRVHLRTAAANLSGGQKQMVAIAQALIGRPRFLLVDELSFGLAPVVVAKLGDVLRVAAGRGVGVLLVEQFTTLALALADRAYVMERGRIVFAGTADDLRSQPDILHRAYLAGGVV